MSIARKNLEHPVLVLIVFALLAAVGLFTLKNVALGLFPDIDSPYVMVSATYANAGPESVEKTVTEILEGALISVNGLKNLYSTSTESGSSIQLEFNYGIDIESAVNDIRDKLGRVQRQLPDAVNSPTIFRFNGDSKPIMRIAVRGNRSLSDIKEIAEDTISDIFEQADGVAEASVMGGKTKIVRIELDQNRLAAYGFTVSQVSSALAKQNLDLGGGKLNEGQKDYVVRTTGEFKSLEEINNTLIQTVNGYDVKLSDIGNAFWGFQDITRDVFINGEHGVYITITKQTDANSVTVSNNVHEKIEELKETLPSDIKLEIISDDTDSIRETINTLVDSAWQGLLLAVIVLFIFLQNVKSTIIIAISIPLSLLITLLSMSFAGITLNMMTLTGLILGVGMIVDASIVMIDNIYSYRSRGAKPKISAILGSQEMIVSVISGNLTTICVFVPFLLYMKDLGMMGQMFKGIIFTIVIALCSSLLVAIFLVPVLAGKFLPLTNRKEKPVKSKIMKSFYGLCTKVLDAITKVYSRILKKALEYRAVTIIIAVCLLVIAISLLPTLGMNMMPQGNDDSVTLSITLPIGTPLEDTRDVSLAMEQIVRKEIPSFEKLITTVGGGGRNANTYKSSIQITLNKDSGSAVEVQNKLRKYFTQFPGAKFSFGAGTRGQMMGSDIDIALRSDDLDEALSVADKIVSVMEDISALGDITIDTEEGLPQVEIEIDRERAYSFGVDVSTVAKEINYAVNGVTSTTYRQAGKDYDVTVMYQPSDRENIIDLETMYVSGTGGKVSLSNFATLKKGLGPVSIKRENQRRIVHITASILTSDNANLVEDAIKEGIANTFIVPDNVSVSYEGSWQDTNEQMKLYSGILIMAILLVFGVMAATYESFKAPLINLATIPFLLIGVVFLYKIIGQPLSIMAMVGLIMLVGIVVNNGIILVDYTNLLRNRNIPMMEACFQAGVSRLRPVLMTTLTTILGMIPMCFASEGQSAMVQPIGIAVVGGLTSSTFVTLLVIPVLYSLVMKDEKKLKSRIKVEYDLLDEKSDIEDKE
ncbi:MAG: efflux RND transporter permease subunit [Spirochaetia bacterium]|nr:efflux RND transporter permease subunit [Spirochaetia bacterium]MCI7108803.1 efflux RND transporter permease subunit [Spirochaetia bacterium]